MADVPTPRPLAVGGPSLSRVSPPGGKQFAEIKRKNDAVKLRVAGFSVEDIALRLAADPQINSDGRSYSYGYGWKRYVRGEDPPSVRQLIKQANADLVESVDRIIDDTDRDSARLKLLNEQRVETMISAAMPKAMSGSERHIGRVIEAVSLLADMHGWKKQTAVVQHEGSVTLTAESPQPELTAEFQNNFLIAVQEANLGSPEQIALLQQAFPAIEASDGDVVDAEIVGETAEPEPVLIDPSIIEMPGDG